MTPRDDDLDAARDDLLRAANRLQALLADATESADVALLRSLAFRLAGDPPAPRPALQSYDSARFHRLLELAGPAHAGELLERLAEDLETARQTAATAARTLDWAALRDASHVLISLTGSVGALSLQAMSEQLNTASHEQDSQALPSLIPNALAELDALIAIIAATPPPHGPAP